MKQEKNRYYNQENNGEQSPNCPAFPRRKLPGQNDPMSSETDCEFDDEFPEVIARIPRLKRARFSDYSCAAFTASLVKSKRAKWIALTGMVLTVVGLCCIYCISNHNINLQGESAQTSQDQGDHSTNESGVTPAIVAQTDQFASPVISSEDAKNVLAASPAENSVKVSLTQSGVATSLPATTPRSAIVGNEPRSTETPRVSVPQSQLAGNHISSPQAVSSPGWNDLSLDAQPRTPVTQYSTARPVEKPVATPVTTGMRGPGDLVAEPRSSSPADIRLVSAQNNTMVPTGQFPNTIIDENGRHLGGTSSSPLVVPPGNPAGVSALDHGVGKASPHAANMPGSAPYQMATNPYPAAPTGFSPAPTGSVTPGRTGSEDVSKGLAVPDANKPMNRKPAMVPPVESSQTELPPVNNGFRGYSINTNRTNTPTSYSSNHYSGSADRTRW